MAPQIRSGDIGVALYLSREQSDESNRLRWFRASVSLQNCEHPEPVDLGAITGWMTRDVYAGGLYEAADSISADAEPLGAVAEQIVDAHPAEYVACVIMIDRMRLEDAWRGRRLTGIMTANLMDLLQLEPGTTVVVLQPEPQKPGVGPMDYGSERDAAMARLQGAYRKSGFEPWREGDVWWMPFDKARLAQEQASSDF